MPQENYQDLEPGYDAENLYLYDWMFHFNPYTQMWAAIPKLLRDDYWNNYNHPRIIRSSSIITLLELIKRTEGDPDKLEQLVNEYLS